MGGRAGRWIAGLRSALARSWLSPLAVLAAVLAGLQAIAWIWNRPAGPWRVLAATAGTVGWRWPVTLLLAGLAADPLVLRLGRNSRLVRLIGRSRLIPVAILAALLTGVLTFAWVYATTPEAASGARTGPSRSNLAVQSGALVAGLAGAASTLWLNDHRRRHDQEELAQERDRVEEERFARAVELLGHDQAAVRVGAMHALAGLARSAAPRTQTVIDVLCAYLRQPCHHPDWNPASASTDTTIDGSRRPGDGDDQDGRQSDEKRAEAVSYTHLTLPT